MARVCVIGSFNLDHVWRVPALPQAGATLAGRYATGPGGKGFNQAIAAARAGADTRFICALGDDAGARLARELCANDGIDLHAAASAAPTGTAGIYVDAEGRNCIVIGAGANAELAPAWVILTPNETEFVALLNRHVGERVDADAVAGLDQPRLHALCRTLLPEGSVIITLGASGCFVSHANSHLRGDEHACYRISAEPAHVVDTTGAGDAFNGALAASLAQRPQRAFIEHVRFAGRYAARSTEHAGAALAMPKLPVA